MRDKWRANGVEAGDLVRLDNGEFEDRLGYGWARGRLKHGDLLVAIAHAGDCFFHYQLLDATRVTRDGVEVLRIEPVGRPFGAYTLGRTIGTLDADALAKIEAEGDDDIYLPIPELYETPADTSVDRHEITSFKDLFRKMRTMPPEMLTSELWLRTDTGRPTLGGTLVMDGRTGKAAMVAND